jgi:hypothetical protein
MTTVLLPPDPVKVGHRLPLLARFDLFYFSAVLLTLIPVFGLAHIPLRIDLVGMTSAYFGSVAVGAIFTSVVLAVIGLPAKQVLFPCLYRYRAEKIRIALALVLATLMWVVFGFWLGTAITINGLTIAEVLDRNRLKRLLVIAVPAIYLLFVVILVFTLNHVLAAIRYAGTFDAMFARWDQSVFHANVSNIAHWGYDHLSIGIYRLLEFAYYSLFAQIGAAMILTALLGSGRYAMKFVRTLFLGYSIALLAFALFPSIGPFSTCPSDLAIYPDTLKTSGTQATIFAKAKILESRQLTTANLPVTIVDYYIGFPCMHIALPIILLWFLRKWNRVVLPLLVFDLLLVPAILFLDWHYLVDLVAGIGVAALAISISAQIANAPAQTDIAQVWEQRAARPKAR